jgi:hypothetical protein
MMLKHLLAAAALLCAWTGSAAAQTAIADQCTGAGAFGERFGASRTAGSTTSSFAMMNAQYVDLDASHAPFTSAEIVFTQHSRRVHTITGLARFDGEEEAADQLAAIAATLARDSRLLPQPAEEETARFHIEGANEGVQLELSLLGSTLMLRCADIALYRRARAEVTGASVSPRPAPATQASWDAAAIAQQNCTAEGAFGQRFGQRPSGRTSPGATEFNHIIAAPAAYAPFTEVEVTITPRSRTIHSISGRAYFGNARDALGAYETLVAAFDASQRFPYRRADALMTGAAGMGFSTREEGSPTGHYALITLEGREVQIVCNDFDRFTGALEEAFSRD